MKYTSSDGLSLDYQLIGDPGNQALILVHGLGANQLMWEPQMTSLPEAGYQLIIPDLRGHGASEMPEEFHLKDCARDLKELLDLLRIQQAHLVGVSMGGMLIQQFALDFPDRTQSLVIVDSLSGITRPAERLNGQLAAALLKIIPPRLQAWLIRKTYQRMGHQQVGIYLSDCLMAMNPDWLLSARLEVNRFNLIQEIPQVSAPTLVLVGDAFGKMALNMARTTSQLIPGAQFQILEGGGDPSSLVVPDQFDEAVIDFLRGI